MISSRRQLQKFVARPDKHKRDTPGEEAMPLSAKLVPSRSDLTALIPPVLTGYRYFEAAAGSRSTPFPFHVAVPDLTVATFLADAALLSYADEPLIRAQLTGGWKMESFLSGLTAQAAVLHCNRTVVVAFRGTQIMQILEGLLDVLLADIPVGLTPWETGGRVHAGVKRSLEEVWSELAAALARLADGPLGPREVWFTGHSLGGALATLAAARFRRAAGLYTFACPRVGDAEFAAKFDVSNVIRFVHCDDLFARCPPRLLHYKHVGTPVYIDKTGRLGPFPVARARPGDTMYTSTWNPLQRWRDGMKLNLIDHAPIFYAAHLGNAYVAGPNAAGISTIPMRSPGGCSNRGE
jgi:triacylglycerol lipase